MVRKSIMLVAGETSGDLLGAELIPHLRRGLLESEAPNRADFQPLRTTFAPHFFGAGGPQMRAAGVELDVDLTQHAVVGLWEVVKKFQDFRRLFVQLRDLAIRRQPEAIVCIDFSGFNLRLAHALRQHVRAQRGTFGNWRPRIIQYVSPQVWASRPGRAQLLARDHDLLLSIIPFEASWYAGRAPGLRVEFVGHPLIDRHAHLARVSEMLPRCGQGAAFDRGAPSVVLLPGSRVSEIRRHLPVLLEALGQLQAAKPRLRASLVAPNEALQRVSRELPLPSDLQMHTGNLAAVLAGADVALASTGTVTLECACFGVPTVALYKTSWATYQAGKRLIQVKFLAMPNLIAGELVFPEFIQDAATPGNLSRAALELLDDPVRRASIKEKLAQVVHSLGPPGASARAAQAIVRLLESEPPPIRTSLG